LSAVIVGDPPLDDQRTQPGNAAEKAHIWEVKGSTSSEDPYVKDSDNNPTSVPSSAAAIRPPSTKKRFSVAAPLEDSSGIEANHPQVEKIPDTEPADGTQEVEKRLEGRAYLVDNSVLQASTPGLQYRSGKSLDTRVSGPGGLAKWGSVVHGTEEQGDECRWLRVTEKRFLPVVLKGVPVLILAPPEPPPPSADLPIESGPIVEPSAPPEPSTVVETVPTKAEEPKRRSVTFDEKAVEELPPMVFEVDASEEASLEAAAQPFVESPQNSKWGSLRERSNAAREAKRSIKAKESRAKAKAKGLPERTGVEAHDASLEQVRDAGAVVDAEAAPEVTAELHAESRAPVLNVVIHVDDETSLCCAPRAPPCSTDAASPKGDA